MNEVWVGVDVSKQSLDVAVRPGEEAWSEQNNQAGIKALTRSLPCKLSTWPFCIGLPGWMWTKAHLPVLGPAQHPARGELRTVVRAATAAAVGGTSPKMEAAKEVLLAAPRNAPDTPWTMDLSTKGLCSIDSGPTAWPAEQWNARAVLSSYCPTGALHLPPELQARAAAAEWC